MVADEAATADGRFVGRAARALRRLDERVLPSPVTAGLLNPSATAAPFPDASVRSRMRYRAAIGEQASAVAGLPLAWCFAGLWAAALIAGAILSPSDALLRPVLAGFVLLWCSLTWWLVPPPAGAAPWERDGPRRPLLIAQLLAIAVVIAYTTIWGAVFHGELALRWLHTVGLYPIFHALDTFSYNHGWPPLEQGLIYVLVPLLVLTALKARPGELGLRRGQRSWRVTLLWTFPLIPSMLAAVAAGTFLHQFLWNAFQNGPMEEFLMRGALLTRIAALWNTANAVIASAIIFGLWHIPANMPPHGSLAHRLATAIAISITDQAVFGIAFGLIFVRTRSLLAGSLIHTITDAF